MSKSIIDDPIYKFLPRVCQKCRVIKDWIHFPMNSKKHSHKGRWCKNCWAKNQAEYKSAFPNKVTSPEEMWKNGIRRKYKITEEQYFKMLSEQNSACAICVSNRSKTKIRLAVDHCHKTGKIRGLLCDVCNRGIGFLSENPLLLRAAAAYLERRK